MRGCCNSTIHHRKPASVLLVDQWILPLSWAVFQGTTILRLIFKYQLVILFGITSIVVDFHIFHIYRLVVPFVNGLRYYLVTDGRVLCLKQATALVVTYPVVNAVSEDGNAAAVAWEQEFIRLVKVCHQF